MVGSTVAGGGGVNAGVGGADGVPKERSTGAVLGAALNGETNPGAGGGVLSPGAGGAVIGVGTAPGGCGNGAGVGVTAGAGGRGTIEGAGGGELTPGAGGVVIGAGEGIGPGAPIVVPGELGRRSLPNCARAAPAPIQVAATNPPMKRLVIPMKR